MTTASSGPSVAVVTGAASGIGAAVAATFADRGWTVYATDVDPSFPSAVAAGCRCLECDVTDIGDCQAVVDRILNTEGRIDVLVNNAGFAAPGPIEDVSIEAARRQFDVIVHGTHAMTQAVLPTMRSQNRGRIVMVSSVLGVVPSPGLGSYSAAKAAIESLAESLRMELSGTGVSVTAVEPAWVDTEFAGRALGQVASDDRTDAYEWIYNAITDGWVVDGGPLATTPEAVAAAVVEAATDETPAARYQVDARSRLIVGSRLLPRRIREVAARGFARLSVPARRLWEFVAGPGDSTADESSTVRLSTGHSVSVPLSTRASVSGVVLSAAADGVEGLLPESLSPVRLTPSRAMITLLSVDYDRIGRGEIDPYNEVAITVPAAAAEAARWPLVSGLSSTVGGYVWQLPVTTEPARALGEEIWGYPKSIGEIEFTDDGRRRQTDLTVDGQHVLSLAVDRPPTHRMGLSLSSYADRAGLCRVYHTLDGEFGVRPLSGRFALELGDHPWADRLRSLDLGGRALLRFGGDCEFTIGPPEAVGAGDRHL